MTRYEAVGGSVAPLENLIEQFAALSGIGVKSAARLAYQVLAMDKEQARAFASAINEAHDRIRRCTVCQNFTVEDDCAVCRGAERDRTTICVVESPRDVAAFENTHEYRGLYHVLHGLISPTEGVGAEHLTVRQLLARLGGGTVREVIMATNPTVEGDATALYLARLIKPLEIKTTRLAYGLPVGSSLEYVDDVTLYRALSGRGEL